MVGHAMDRWGLKDPENASNSLIPKINRTVFWDLGTDMKNINFFCLNPEVKTTLYKPLLAKKK